MGGHLIVGTGIFSHALVLITLYFLIWVVFTLLLLGWTDRYQGDGSPPGESPDGILSLVGGNLKTTRKYTNGVKEAAQIIGRRLPE